MFCTLYFMCLTCFSCFYTQSLNGVWINGSRIPAGNPFLLKQGNSVRLGVPLDGNPVEFDYILVQKNFSEVKSFLSGNLSKESDVASVGQKLKNSKRKLDADESEQCPTQNSNPSCTAAPARISRVRSPVRPGSAGKRSSSSLNPWRRTEAAIKREAARAAAVMKEVSSWLAYTATTEPWWSWRAAWATRRSARQSWSGSSTRRRSESGRCRICRRSWSCCGVSWGRSRSRRSDAWRPWRNPSVRRSDAWRSAANESCFFGAGL